MRSSLLPTLALLTGLVACVPPAGMSPHASRGPAAESPALGLERELARLVAEHEGVLWPGFDALSVPLAVYDGEATFLFRHPAPPDGFEPASGAHFYDGRHPAVTANSVAEIGGVLTATILLDRGQAPSDVAATALHEAFHAFQRTHQPTWSANEADLFVYPVDDPSLLALRRLETEALRRAMTQPDADAAACWARSALAFRTERFASMDAAFASYERLTELNEGLAYYVELRVSGREDVGFRPDAFAPADVRNRAYATGAALAMLLDRFSPGWPAAFVGEAETLDTALAAALGDGTTCSFGESERTAASRRARSDVEVLAEERLAIRQAFEARPGWRVVVEASRQPLWPQGFDPVNVDRVGTADVLHRRFLRLGNEAGSLETLDAAALTEGVGPHPLFNGIRRVVLTGLEEPSVDESDGVVRVRAGGFAAELRGARVERAGQEIVIRLGP